MFTNSKIKIWRNWNLSANFFTSSYFI